AGPGRPVRPISDEGHAVPHRRRGIRGEEVRRQHGKVDVAVGGDPCVAHVAPLGDRASWPGGRPGRPRPRLARSVQERAGPSHRFVWPGPRRGGGTPRSVLGWTPEGGAQGHVWSFVYVPPRDGTISRVVASVYSV